MRDAPDDERDAEEVEEASRGAVELEDEHEDERQGDVLGRIAVNRMRLKSSALPPSPSPTAVARRTATTRNASTNISKPSPVRRRISESFHLFG
jgi:hypothetical protein